MNFEQPPKKELISLEDANVDQIFEIQEKIKEDESVRLEYSMLANEEALDYMKKENSEYFNREFSGETKINENGMMYLLNKNGEETSITPEQAMGQAAGSEVVYKNAIKRFLEKNPEKAEEFGVAI